MKWYLVYLFLIKYWQQQAYVLRCALYKFIKLEDDKQWNLVIIN